MNRKIKKLNAFTLAEGGQSPLLNGDGGHSPLLNGDEGTQNSPIKSLSRRERVVAVARQGLTATGEGANAFTLAEVLITLGVIGVVAAVTMPTLVTNIQDKVRKEQVRTVKYKLTKATDKMKSLGKIGPYDAPATMNFVNELKKHMTIAKVCDSGNLSECWPSETVNTYQNNSPTLSSVSVSSLKKGTGLNALAVSSGGEDTVGIVTGDGVPMLLVYSPKCEALDEVKTYTWSVEDGKPVTNATTNCISAIFDINGSKGPNRVGQDIRTLNSLFGSIDLGAVTGITSEECNKVRTTYGINECCTDCDANRGDRWAAGVIACAKMGLHLPDMMTLANIANSRYGSTLIGAYTLYISSDYGGDNCKDYVKNNWGSSRINESDAIICNANTTPDPSSGFSITGAYFSSLEYSSTIAYERYFGAPNTNWFKGYRYYGDRSLCVGD